MKVRELIGDLSSSDWDDYDVVFAINAGQGIDEQQTEVWGLRWDHAEKKLVLEDTYIDPMSS